MAQQQQAMIRQAKGKDAPAMCRLRRKVWLDTYPNETYQITRTLLDKLFEFTSAQNVTHYRALILGEAVEFTQDSSDEGSCSAYQKNCAPISTQAPPTEGDSTENRECFWVAEWKNKGLMQMIAYASANRFTNVITTIYVDPAWQGKGIGQQLFMRLCDHLDTARPIALRVVSYNEQAIQFYQKRGFEKQQMQEVDIEQGRIFPSWEMMRPADNN